MKCIILIAALCCLGVCSGQGLDFLHENILQPMVNEIYNNAINMLGQQLSGLLNGLFGGIGKRGIQDVLNMNVVQNLLAPFIGQIKDIYENLYQVFLQIVHHAEDWIQKPDWARIEFVHAAADAEEKLSKVKINIEALQPLVALVQKHFGAFITDLEAIIVRVMQAVRPLQSLTGSLLKP